MIEALSAIGKSNTPWISMENSLATSPRLCSEGELPLRKIDGDPLAAVDLRGT
jgi:hypothetical protein